MRSWHEARKTRPELQGAHRARLILNFDEAGECTRSAETGWAQLDGPWVHWISDEDEPCWQSWPLQHVICVEWLPRPNELAA